MPLAHLFGVRPVSSSSSIDACEKVCACWCTAPRTHTTWHRVAPLLLGALDAQLMGAINHADCAAALADGRVRFFRGG